jgi:hypothetical protein
MQNLDIPLIGNRMKSESKHLECALKHKWAGTELKLINGKYYLYGLKSVYDKTLQKSKKMSLGIIGRITAKGGQFLLIRKNVKRKFKKVKQTKKYFFWNMGMPNA